MFTSIKIKNYKSLVDLEVNLAQKRNEPKPLILIYGENGVGKSNFADIFYTLYETLQTCSIRKLMQKILEEKENISYENETVEAVLKMLSESLRDTESIIKSCKTKNSSENMVMEFGFVIKGIPGNYLLAFDDSKIVHEKLDFVLNKNK